MAGVLFTGRILTAGGYRWTIGPTVDCLLKQVLYCFTADWHFQPDFHPFPSKPQPLPWVSVSNSDINKRASLLSCRLSPYCHVEQLFFLVLLKDHLSLLCRAIIFPVLSSYRFSCHVERPQGVETSLHMSALKISPLTSFGRNDNMETVDMTKSQGCTVRWHWLPKREGAHDSGKDHRLYSLGILFKNVPYRLLGLICGKKSTSWMVGELVMNIVRRSIPIPSPDVGGIPYSSARTKSISMNIASSSPLSFSLS